MASGVQGSDFHTKMYLCPKKTLPFQGIYVYIYIEAIIKNPKSVGFFGCT